MQSSVGHVNQGFPEYWPRRVRECLTGMLRWGRICRETMDQISVFQKRNKQQFVVAEIANGVTFADAGSAQ